MFWNKLRNYVETVDGYLIRKDEAKKVIEKKNSLGEKEKTLWYRKENAPKYDFANSYLSWGSICQNYYKNNVQVNKDGTPIGYISLEEADELKARIKSLQEQLRHNDFIDATKYMIGCDLGMGNSATKFTKTKKAGRPNGSKNNKK
jgi:hypothetical protein